MIEMLRPLSLNTPYVGNQLLAMIDTMIKPEQISEDTYIILAKQCEQYFTTMLIDERKDIFVLTNIDKKIFGIAPIRKQFYESIMARTILH